MLDPGPTGEDVGHGRLGQRFRELRVERAGRPIDRHPVAREEPVSAGLHPGGAMTGGLPGTNVLRVPEDLAMSELY